MTIHNQACKDAFSRHEKDLTTFRKKYPNACTKCHGWGGFYSTYDPSPAGVSLSPGYLEDFDPCGDCEGTEEPRCALCGKPMRVFDEEGEELYEPKRACDCPKDQGEPEPPECLCWLADEDQCEAPLCGGGDCIRRDCSCPCHQTKRR